MHRPYLELLDCLKTLFPTPLSDPILDGYFVHTVSRFLDQVDDLKSAVPLLGKKRENHYDACQGIRFPEGMSSVAAVTKQLAEHCQGMPIWSHPNAQVNVIPPPTIPAILAAMVTAIYNPNIIWDEYSARFAEAEIKTLAMLSDLVGYDPHNSGGVFTFGGTGTILYGCKLALEKISGGRSMAEGIREDSKIVASASSHYSRLNVCGWLGLGTRNLVTVPTNRRHEMDLAALEEALRQILDRGERVAALIATLGTTDAFAIDDLAAIVRLKDSLAREYGLEHLPHVHADAVIGWAWATFRDYDFEKNPLRFHPRTLRSLNHSLERLGDLSLADSIGFDFHKTGYAPYLSSAFLVRDRRGLDLLSRQPEQMPYLYQFGCYHPGVFTLECSRSGAGALAAFANLQLLGKKGYRILIGHAVEMAEMLRERLEQHPFIQVLNEHNFGPVTLFRVYPDGVEAGEACQRELLDPAWQQQVAAYNAYNRRIFDLIHQRAMRGEGVLLSWTDAYRQADYGDEPGPPISALKSFILSPWTDIAAVATVVRQVLEAREQVNYKAVD
jgi:glutamate/tyrosine decarboxylase-like PLP-dependent enzyme